MNWTSAAHDDNVVAYISVIIIAKYEIRDTENINQLVAESSLGKVLFVPATSLVWSLV